MSLIPLNRNYLKAMLLVAAKEDVRYYLCSIYFVCAEGKVLAYATDGHQAMRWIVQDDYQGNDFEYIIDRRAIKDAIKTKYNIHLDVETGEIICAKDGDFRRFTGLVDAKYPNIKKVAQQWIREIGDEQSDQIVFSAYKVAKLAKIGRIISKDSKSKDIGICQYNRASSNNIYNIFTFHGIDNLMYLMTTSRHMSVTDNEKYAVTMDGFAREKSIVEDIIASGFAVECGASRHSYKTAISYAKSKSRVFCIVDYDDNCFMDSDGDIWQYVHRVDSNKVSEQVAA